MGSIISDFENIQVAGQTMTGFVSKVESVTSVKMQTLEMVVQPGRKLGFKKAICQRRPMGLGNNRSKIKLTFLAVSKETPPDEKWLVQISFEDDPKDIWAAKKKLQDKIRGINLKRFVEREPGQIHGILHLGGLGFVFF